MQSYIKVEDAKSAEHNVQEKLIQLARINKIAGDLYLGNRDIFWQEETRDLLTKFVLDMKKVSHGDGYRKLYILDTASYYFSISDIDVEFEDLTDEEIYNNCIQDEDGRMMYNVTNDIYIPFEKAEFYAARRRYNTRVSRNPLLRTEFEVWKIKAKEKLTAYRKDKISAAEFKNWFMDDEWMKF